MQRGIITRSRYGMLAVILTAMSMAPHARGGGFTLVINVETGSEKFAGTDDPVYFALIHVDTDSNSPSAEKAAKPAMKRTEVSLARKGNDREVGAIDTYRFKFDFNPEEIREIEIGMKGKGDAWHLVGFDYTVERGKEKSLPTKIHVDRWLSIAEEDQKAKLAALPLFTKKVPPPQFPPK